MSKKDRRRYPGGIGLFLPESGKDGQVRDIASRGGAA
jgi:hypothetical protein